MASTDFDQASQAAVETLRARHGWNLLEPDTFARRTVVALQTNAATEPMRAAVHVYSLALYTACSGQEGAARQELAYSELFRYLYTSAYHRYPEVCEDAAQEAIERVYTHFDRCRVPPAFLAWAFQHLRDAARRLLRQTRKLVETPFDQSSEYALDLLGGVGSLPRVEDPAEQRLVHERQSHLERLVGEFLHKHPRSAEQLTALLLRDLWGLEDDAISARLGKPVSTIYVLRSRAKKKLREEPSWRAFAEELGFL